jgi:hypothetical protein
VSTYSSAPVFPPRPFGNASPDFTPTAASGFPTHNGNAHAGPSSRPASATSLPPLSATLHPDSAASVSSATLARPIHTHSKADPSADGRHLPLPLKAPPDKALNGAGPGQTNGFRPIGAFGQKAAEATLPPALTPSAKKVLTIHPPLPSDLPDLGPFLAC